MSVCELCFYLQNGFWLGEAPRERDDIQDARRDADPKAKCSKHRAEADAWAKQSLECRELERMAR